MSKTYVHFGGSWCGPAPYEFDNFDASPTLRLERLPLIGLLVNKIQNVSLKMYVMETSLSDL